MYIHNTALQYHGQVLCSLVYAHCFKHYRHLHVETYTLAGLLTHTQTDRQTDTHTHTVDTYFDCPRVPNRLVVSLGKCCLTIFNKKNK